MKIRNNQLPAITSWTRVTLGEKKSNGSKVYNETAGPEGWEEKSRRRLSLFKSIKRISADRVYVRGIIKIKRGQETGYTKVRVKRRRGKEMQPGNLKQSHPSGAWGRQSSESRPACVLWKSNKTSEQRNRTGVQCCAVPHTGMGAGPGFVDSTPGHDWDLISTL